MDIWFPRSGVGIHLSDAPALKLVLKRIVFFAISCECKAPGNCAATLERGNEAKSSTAGLAGSGTVARSCTAGLAGSCTGTNAVSTGAKIAEAVAISTVAGDISACVIAISTAA